MGTPLIKIQLNMVNFLFDFGATVKGYKADITRTFL
ncbi:MAG: hypothetical protein CM15mP70_08880 [Pelagibacteraceae bacterium]|nr:MAG: hypothetical protein CM15mP70_08880 [Pelagibacteraceae bacterium]